MKTNGVHSVHRRKTSVDNYKLKTASYSKNAYNIQSRKVFYNACFVAVLSGRMFMLCSSVSNMFMLCSSAREIRDYLSTSAFATIELE